MKKLIILCLLSMMIVQPAHACNVPVFRYALERWWPDSYGVFLFYEKSLNEEEAALAAWLEKQASGDKVLTNFYFKKVDVASEEDKRVMDFWNAQKEKTLPRLVVAYPMIAPKPLTAWSGPLKKEQMTHLLDSPARKAIGDGILNGDCAVWVFLPGTDAEKNKAARTLLETTLKEMEKVLTLPAGYGDPEWDGTGFEEEGADDTGYQETEVPALEDEARVDAPEAPEASDTEEKMDKGDGEKPDDKTGEATPTDGQEAQPDTLPKIAFSVLEVSKKDENERLLISMLLGSEPDLHNLKEPMVFPVFGRGRALYVLVGEGINRENIAEACYFLVGPCSCQVKGMNPGVDLLMTVDWEGRLFTETVEDVELPPLPGMAMLDNAKTDDDQNNKPQPADIDQSEQDPDKNIDKNQSELDPDTDTGNATEIPLSGGDPKEPEPNKPVEIAVADNKATGEQASPPETRKDTPTTDNGSSEELATGGSSTMLWASIVAGGLLLLGLLIGTFLVVSKK